MSVRYPTSSIESRFERVGLVAADAGSSRLVYAMVFALIVIGVVLIVVAVVVFRRTRVDPDVLAPLERMGSRKWRKGDPESRRELLDAVRPAGATAPSPTDPDDAPVGLPPPVIESDSAAPHEATFVAGPDGVEPVDAAEPVEVVEPVEAVEPVEVVEPVEAAEHADAEVDPAVVVPTASDEAGTASDVPVAAPDDVVAASDETVAVPDDVAAAPDFSLDDDGTSTDDVVDAPVEPIDGSVTGQ